MLLWKESFFKNVFFFAGDQGDTEIT